MAILDLKNMTPLAAAVLEYTVDLNADEEYVMGFAWVIVFSYTIAVSVILSIRFGICFWLLRRT